MHLMFCRFLLGFLIYGLVCPPWVFAAGVTADPAASADKRPGVDAAPNGVPLVNIARPNGAGLSHNQYEDFNVGREGLIFNNSDMEGRSQMGGIVYGNPNFEPGGRKADAILNEVTSANRSRLEGYMEVFGKSADVILANPNGITVNGAGFVNVPRAALTTGVPNVEGGQLRSFDVERGDISIEGKGVNATNMDAFSLYSRTASVTADVYANELVVTTGRNRVNAATGEAAPLADGKTADAPAVSLDTSLLGGMYAGRITMTSTEKGVGVNLQGTVQSTSDMTLTSDGKLTLREAGAAGDATVSARDVEVTEQLAAGRDLSVTAAETATVNGAATANRHVSVTGRDVVLNKAEMAAGVNGNSVSGPGDLTISASRSLKADDSRVLAGRNIKATGGDVAVQGGLMAAQENLNISGKTLAAVNAALSAAELALSGENVTGTGGAWSAQENLAVNASRDLNLTDATFGAGKKIAVTAGTVKSVGTTMGAGGPLTVTSSGDLNLKNARLGTDDALSLTSGGGLIMSDSALSAVKTLAANSSGGMELVKSTLGANEALSLTADGGLNLTSSTLGSVGTLTLKASGDATVANSKLGTDAALALTSGGKLTMTDAELGAGGPLTVVSDASMSLARSTLGADAALAVTTSGGLSIDVSTLGAGGSIDVSAMRGMDLKNAKFGSNGDLAVASDDRLTMTGSTLSATGDLSVRANGQFRMDGGQVEAARNLTLALADAAFSGGSLLALNNLKLTSAALKADELSLTAGEDADLTVGGALTLTNAKMGANGSLSVQAGNFRMDGGRMEAARNLSLVLADAAFTGGVILAQKDLTLNSAALTATRLSLAAGGKADLDVSAGLTLTDAELGAGGGLAVNAVGKLQMQGGKLATNQNLTLNSADAVFTGGSLLALGGLKLKNSSLTANGLALAVGSDADFTIGGGLTLTDVDLGAGGGFSIQAGNFRMDRGKLAANGSLGLNVGDAVLTGGSLLALGDLSLKSASLTANTLAFTAGGDAAIETGTLSAADSSLGAVGALRVSGDGVTLTRNKLLSGDAMSIVAVKNLGLTDNTASSGGDFSLKGVGLSLASNSLQSGGNAALAGTTATLTGGSIRSAFDLSLTGGLSATNATLSAGRTLTLKGDTFNMRDGALSSAGNLQMEYGTLAVDGALLAAGSDLAVTSNSLTNRGGALYAGQDAFLFIRDKLWNDGGELYARRDMSVAGVNGARLAQLLNQSGSIAADGNMQMYVGTLTNEKRAFGYTLRNLISQSGETVDYHHESDTLIKETYTTVSQLEDRITQDSPVAKISVGRNLSINSNNLYNNYSFIAAGGDVSLATGNLTNMGLELRETTKTDLRYRMHFHEHGDDNYWDAGTESLETYTRIGLAPAAITAGGTLTATVSGNLNNFSQNVTPFAPSRSDDSRPGSVDLTRPVRPDGAGVPSGLPADIPAGTTTLPGGTAGAPSNLPSGTPAGLPSGSPQVSTSKPTLALPKSPLFKPNANPNHPYKLETNPALTDMGNFYGSQYFLNRMGVDLSALQHQLLGDAFYETRLVQDQLMAQTGRRFLNGYDTDADQMRALMDNAAEQGLGLNLTMGVELSPMQVAALTKDIVWLVEEEYEGETVLVPKLYLAEASREDLLGGGATLAGRDVYLSAGEALLNSGDIKGRTVKAVADTIINSGGKVSGADLTMLAQNDLVNIGGLISGDTLTLAAGRDIVSRSSTLSYVNPHTVGSQIASLAGIESRGDMTVRAGRDLLFQGSALSAGGNALIAAGNDLVIHTVATGYDMESSGKGYSSNMHKVENTLSTLETGGNLTINAGGDAMLAGAQVLAGGDAKLHADGDVTITAVADSSSQYAYGSISTGGFGGSSSSGSVSSANTTVVGSTLGAKGNLTVTAGRTDAADKSNIMVVGSTLGSNGDTTLAATGGIAVASVGQTSSSHSTHSDKGFMSSKKEESGSSSVWQIGSEITGNNVTLDAGTTLRINASNIGAENDINLAARDGDLLISDAANSSDSFSSSKETGWGVGGSGNFYSFYGSSSVRDTANGTTSVGSSIQAGHDVNMTASRDVALVHVNVGAGNDITIGAGRDVNILPGENTASTTHDQKSSGFGVSATASVAGGLSGFAGYQSSAKGNAMDAEKHSATELAAGNNLTVTAGNNINTMDGKLLAGNDLALTAGNDINLLAAEDRESVSSYSKKTSIGLTLTANSPTVSRAVNVYEKTQKTVKDTQQYLAGGQAGSSLVDLYNTGKNVVGTGTSLWGMGKDTWNAASGSVTALLNPDHSAADVFKPLFQPSVGVSLSAGLSTNSSQQSQTVKTPAVTELVAGNDAHLLAGRDMTMEGTQISTGGDLALAAGRDLDIHAAQGSSQSSSSSSGFDAKLTGTAILTPTGYGVMVTPQVGVNANKGNSQSATNQNAQLTAGGNLSIITGQDATLAGANLTGDTVSMDIGHNLNVSSVQDSSESSSMGGKLEVSAPLGSWDGETEKKPTPTSILSNEKISANWGSSSSQLVGTQTSIIGANGVDIRVEGNTDVKGAVIAALNNNLKLDTGTLTFSNLAGYQSDRKYGLNLTHATNLGVQDIDVLKDWNLQKATGYNRDWTTYNAKDLARHGLPEKPKQGDPSPPKPHYNGYETPPSIEEFRDDLQYLNGKWKGAFGVLSPQGTYASSGSEQGAVATIGQGTIIVRDNPDMDLSGLNRNPANSMQMEEKKPVNLDSKDLTDKVPEALDPNKGWKKLDGALEILYAPGGYLEGRLLEVQHSLGIKDKRPDIGTLLPPETLWGHDGALSLPSLTAKPPTLPDFQTRYNDAAAKLGIWTPPSVQPQLP